jgi:hypothetical protein
MLAGTTIVVLIVAAAILLRSSKTSTRSKPDDRRPGARSSRYHGVSCHPPLQSCDAALKVAGSRYLVAEAPQFPLSDCSARQCRCKYRHHEDRRSEDADRRVPFGLRNGLFGAMQQQELRTIRGRRTSDMMPA